MPSAQQENTKTNVDWYGRSQQATDIYSIKGVSGGVELRRGASGRVDKFQKPPFELPTLTLRSLKKRPEQAATTRATVRGSDQQKQIAMLEADFQNGEHPRPSSRPQQLAGTLQGQPTRIYVPKDDNSNGHDVGWLEVGQTWCNFAVRSSELNRTREGAGNATTPTLRTPRKPQTPGEAVPERSLRTPRTPRSPRLGTQMLQGVLTGESDDLYRHCMPLHYYYSLRVNVIKTDAVCESLPRRSPRSSASFDLEDSSNVPSVPQLFGEHTHSEPSAPHFPFGGQDTQESTSQSLLSLPPKAVTNMLDPITSLTSTLSFSSPRSLSSVMPPNTEKHDSITVYEPRQLSATQAPILPSARTAAEVFSHNRLSSMHIASAIHYPKVSDQSKRVRQPQSLGGEADRYIPREPARSQAQSTSGHIVGRCRATLCHNAQDPSPCHTPKLQIATNDSFLSRISFATSYWA
jgi:hypothetical protein